MVLTYSTLLVPDNFLQIDSFFMFLSLDHCRNYTSFFLLQMSLMFPLWQQWPLLSLLPLHLFWTIKLHSHFVGFHRPFSKHYTRFWVLPLVSTIPKSVFLRWLDTWYFLLLFIVLHVIRLEPFVLHFSYLRRFVGFLLYVGLLYIV